MAQNIGNDGNQSPMADDELLNDLQEITNPSVRQSVSLPVIPSSVPPSMSTQRPYIQIIEEPTNKIIRFRYECEGRTAGSIAGMHSTPTKKTYPTIQICNYNGPVVILVISCVTVEQPYLQHPHHLISKDEGSSCKDGIYRRRLGPNEHRFELQKVGIQCVKKSGVHDSLKKRMEKKIDPFSAGFNHLEDLTRLNLYQLRLCYQAYIKVDNNYVSLDPVVSSPIYGKSNELTITRLCSCSSKMSGGDEIIMLCDKVSKNDIRIRFFETNDEGDVVWEADATFQNQDVYKQMAIVFRTPRYRNPETQKGVQVELQLVRPSDGATSEPRPFEYYPNPDTMPQRYRDNAKKMTESIKRKLPVNFNQSFKQSRTLPMDTLSVPQTQAPFFPTHQSSTVSPTNTCVPEIKNEQAMLEMYNNSNYPSVSSSPNFTYFPPSPGSSCSGTGYGTEAAFQPNMKYLDQQRQQELQQMQQQQQFYQCQPQSQSQLPDELEVTRSLHGLTMTDNSYPMTYNQGTHAMGFHQFNSPMSANGGYQQISSPTSINGGYQQSSSPTYFNGGSLIPTNPNNLNNMNNNNLYSPNMNAPSPLNYIQYDDPVLPQPQTEAQLQEPTAEEPEASMSDIIRDFFKDGNVVENLENVITKDFEVAIENLARK
ncbi:dorsal-related immunity factor Dif isoform X3 [Drosophila innubila]|uniref:dorsal-related immunity factor Dif isoform X3 n=1 Tax=Drosophila innubila TaxID=198719 RepID=UPI00148DD561|nr:dorsal-related immunity factor Dif isoform X3 [Drosophila innubila]